MTGIRWMIEDGQADGFAIHVPPIVNPSGGFAPEILVMIASAIDRFPIGHPALQVKVGMGADGHGAFFRVAEDHITVRCLESDLEIEVTRLAEFAEGHASFILADFLAAHLRQPFAPGHEDGLVFAIIHLHHGIMHDFAAFLRVPAASLPEIEAVDVAMGVPERGVMGMIDFLASTRGFQGKLPRHGDPIRSDDWVEAGVVQSFVFVSRKGRPIDVNGILAIEFFDRDLCRDECDAAKQDGAEKQAGLHESVRIKSGFEDGMEAVEALDADGLRIRRAVEDFDRDIAATVDLLQGRGDGFGFHFQTPGPTGEGVFVQSKRIKITRSF